ncbi:hypothetical protein M2262_003163 [Pseudomonas sp. BIGb0408]|uniref:Alpha-amylase n=1 Tax=Phytopseudomonas flavescens TaxID=29435 RepID=A0A7Y9XLR3_9GAMM|nr:MULTISPECIES: hypothetical protein [Pseudomonas]MCW2293113.1 hypothetical protein [Pseudomonas sp. BIGb0408]NYH72317.1 hypothetical protein [Pseudomonas flavescens]
MSVDNKTQQQKNHHSDQLNRNRGSSGSNQANSKANGNRGKQLNPNQR